MPNFFAVFKERVKRIGSRVNGLTILVGGVSWVPAPDEQKIIYRLMQRLADRRVLRHTHGLFIYERVIDSLRVIRADVTSALEELPPDSRARPLLESGREALQALQTLVEQEFDSGGRLQAPPTDQMREALEDTRAVVAEILAKTCEAYGTDLAPGVLRSFSVAALGVHDQ